MINDIKKDGESRMNKSVEALENAFAKLRTGRAHPEGCGVLHLGARTFPSIHVLFGP